MDINTATNQIHFPQDFQNFNRARKRLVFDELLSMQLGLLALKYENNEQVKGIKYDKNKIKAAHLWCQTMVKQFLSRGIDVCVSNTFVKKWEIDEYVKMANTFNTNYKIIKVVGNYKNVHNVPSEVVERMKQNWEDYDGEETYKNM